MPVAGEQTPHERAAARLALATSAASGTWEWDIVGNRLFADANFARLYGIAPEQAAEGVSPATFFTAMHADDRPRMRIAVAGMLGGAELFSKEFRLLPPDGSVMWVHGRGRCHFDADDRPVRFTGLLVDVSERKRAEERLRVAQSAGGIGTFEYVEGFATATVSAQFCRLLGLHPASVLPVPTINRVVAPGEPSIVPVLHAGGGETDPVDREIRIARADNGAACWIARRGEIVRDPEGSGVRFIGVLYDVTGARAAQEALRELNETLEARVRQEIAEREQAEDALRQAQKMEAVGQLTGGIAHDFNNLLTIIIGNIDTAMRRLGEESDPRARRALENAQKGAERAGALTQRLLAFSRRQPLDPKPTDFGRLLAGMSDLLTRAIGETIAIQLDAPPSLWPIEVDQHQLENAILNLAVNARDAMPEGGSLTVAGSNVTVEAKGPAAPPGVRAGQHVMIAVSDTGAGMAPDTVARAFEPFFTTKDVGKGTGLGLSMVYGFVKQSGGHITIDSTAGEGTTIRLYLPRLMASIEEEAPALEACVSERGGSESILVVEDDDDVRAYTVGTLRELGYRVIEAQDARSALRLIDRADSRVELLLTDVVMPVMSGPELAEAALLLRPALKVLFMSGYTRDRVMRGGRLEQGVELLSKPFTFDTLAARVRDLLDKPPPAGV